MSHNPPSDWVLSPNIHHNTEIYALENQALLRDGRLEEALRQCADWTGKTLLDIGCGTGFWLPEYAKLAHQVFGVEPDPTLLPQAMERSNANIRVQQGSAESIPLEDESVDIVHARFAYFMGTGAEQGLQEVMRVLRPGGTFVAVDNSWNGGEFAQLLRQSQQGNGTINAEATQAWWAAQGARRVEVEGGWRCTSPEELERVLRIEFHGDVVDAFVGSRAPSPDISYNFALFVMDAP